MRLQLSNVILLIVALNFSLSAQHCLSLRYSETALFDSADVVVLQNIQYGLATQYFTGQETPLLMDVYYPDMNADQMEERPLILNIHGGGFIGGDKNELTYQSLEFAKRGFVVANINYRLGWNCDNVLCINCFGSSLQKAVYCAVQDARAALRFSVDHAADWGIDTDWIFVNGQSAGSITALHTAFWSQQEADAQVSEGFSSEVGLLDASGNNSTSTYSIKGLVNQCGAMANRADMDDQPNIPVISFHDSNDCVVNYNYGPLIACFCSGFLYYYGSNSIHGYRLENGMCSELHTAPQVLPNHCTYPQLNLVKLASCFLKRTMCGYCFNFADDDINAAPICANQGATSTLPPNDPLCPADLNLDGVVGVADVILMIEAYGTICE
jgi:poly(3-hydroxybutyrate) depolymerase